MSKKFTLKHVGEVTVDESGTVKIHAENGIVYALSKNFEVTVANFAGDSNSSMEWFSFEQFVLAMTSGDRLHGDAEKALFCWVEMFYVQQYLKHEPTCTLDRRLWEKTYEFDGAVTAEEKAASVAGWHVFTDGKELAVIWSSDGYCENVVPLIGKEIIYLDAEAAVIKL